MREKIRRRLTYANVMATIAAFGVLAGGGAYAASKVGPKDIKRNAVRAAITAVERGRHAVTLRVSGIAEDDDTSVEHGALNVIFVPFGTADERDGGPL